MSHQPRAALALLALAGAGATAAAQQIETIRVLDVPATSFPFFVSSNSLLNAIPDLGGMEIVAARMSFDLELNPDSLVDISTAEFSMRAPIFDSAGGDAFATATFLGSDILFFLGDTSATGSVETDLLNGPIRNNTQIGGDKKKGKGEGELIPAAAFEWNATASEFQFGDPEWATLVSLYVEIDVRPVPTPGALPLLAGTCVLATRRRRA